MKLALLVLIIKNGSAITFNLTHALRKLAKQFSVFFPLMMRNCCNAAVASFDIDNAVMDRPVVHCGIDNIVVEIDTEKPFGGRLYVQGEAENEHCLQAASKEDSGTHVKFDLPIGACNMRRQRTMHPRGVSFSFTLVVSFHHFFVTGMDRAFHIRCFFLESVKNLHTEFNVGTLKTEIVEQEYQLPECIYQLRDGLGGPALRYAQVELCIEVAASNGRGSLNIHIANRWDSALHIDGAVMMNTLKFMTGSSWVYGLLIHSCFADDGQGNKFELIDDRGCSTDSYLLPQIQYEPNSLSAFTNAQVFKYADKVQLYFTCTVQLCYKHDGGCEGVTPPSCKPDSVHVSHHHPQFELPGRGPPVEIPPGHPRGEDAHQGNGPFYGLPPNSKPFFGPLNPINEYDSSKYRDSPLNETDVEDISLTHSNSSTADVGKDRTIKKRRDLNMETDLSVDVIVLPFDEKTRRPTAVSPNVCFSKTATILLFLSVVVTAALCSTVTYVFARRSSSYQKSMDAF